MCDGQTNIFPLVKIFLPGLFSSNLPQNSLKTSAWTQAFNTYPCHKNQAKTVELDRVRTNKQTDKQPYANFNIDGRQKIAILRRLRLHWRSLKNILPVTGP